VKLEEKGRERELVKRAFTVPTAGVAVALLQVAGEVHAQVRGIGAHFLQKEDEREAQKTRERTVTGLPVGPRWIGQ